MTTHVLTKATLSPATRNVGALLAETSGVDGGHRLLWTLFPSEPSEKSTRDFLFRKIDDRSYLVVSKKPPVDAHALWQLGPKPYEPKPQVGERYSFILRANPAMAARSDTGRSVRVDAVMHAKRAAKSAGNPWGREEEADAALSWLIKREAAIGVVFEQQACHARNYVQVRIARKGEKPVHFSSVDYEGVLTVVDADRFNAALFGGVGKARAFGCGLMLIRRAHHA